MVIPTHRPGRILLAQFVSDAVSVMDALTLEKVHWVGISTGGMIGQGRGYPSSGTLFASLSLCNTTSLSLRMVSGMGKRTSGRRARERHGPGLGHDRQAMVHECLCRRANADYHAVRDVFIKTPMPGYLGGTVRGCRPRLSARSRQDQGADADHRGGDDPVTPIVRAEEIRDGIAGSQLMVIDGQRHFSNVEVPDAFNTILRRGLDEMQKEAS